jgi:hypothetical protein
MSPTNDEYGFEALYEPEPEPKEKRQTAAENIAADQLQPQNRSDPFRLGMGGGFRQLEG